MIAHTSNEILSSFAWHRSNECRMLTVTQNGLVEVISLNETVPLTWSPHGDLCFGFVTAINIGPAANPNTISDVRYAICCLATSPLL